MSGTSERPPYRNDNDLMRHAINNRKKSIKNESGLSQFTLDHELRYTGFFKSSAEKQKQS